MQDRIIIGNKLIRLEEVDSTNEFLKKCLLTSKNESEGLVVTALNQLSGKGQRGNLWQTESAKNLTFSILLKPNISVDSQFKLTQIVSIAIINFLKSENINAKIKWPNDIYIDDKKIGGILIENTIKKSKINTSIVGIGLNINQIDFDEKLINPTSLKLQTKKDFELDLTLNRLLNFVDKTYLLSKTQMKLNITDEYLSNLYRYNELCNYKILNKECLAKIVGVSAYGKLLLDIKGEVQDFDLKEVKFLF